MVNIDYRITMMKKMIMKINHGSYEHDQPFRKPQSIKHDKQ